MSPRPLPSPRPCVLFAALAAALLLVDVSPHSAQEADDALPGFGDTVEVNVVNVEVRVTDRDDRPIRGLTRDDFVLMVDGEVVPITHFTAVDGRRQESPRPERLAPEATTAPLPATLAVQALPDQRLNLVVYVDNVNARELTRNRALGELRRFLRGRMQDGDRAMVVTFDQTLTVRQAMTSDREAVISTLFELENLPSHRRSVDSFRRDLLHEIYQAEDLLEVSARSRQYAEMVYGELEGAVDGLAELVDSLAGLPGRTAVIYLSDGVPMTAAEDIFVALEDRFPGESSTLLARDYDASRRFRVLAHQANSHGVTLYTLDASGLRTHGNVDVASYQAAIGTVVESTHVANLQDPLFLLAHDTGGQVIANTNLIAEGLDRVGDDFDHYYSLATTFGGSGSGRYHALEVLVPGRRDLRIRHREGFRDKRIESRMAESTLAALHYGTEVDDLGVTVSFDAPRRPTERGHLVAVEIAIPMSRLVFVPRGETQVSRLHLFISAEHEGGTTSPVEQVRVPIEIPTAKLELAMQHEYRLRHQLLMAPGRHRVAVGIRDELGAGSSVVVTSVDVGP